MGGTTSLQIGKWTGRKKIRRGIAQEENSEMLGGGKAMLAAFIVFPPDQGMGNTALDQQQADIMGKGNGLHLRLPAIKEDRMILFSKKTRNLVQNTALHADILVLGAAAKLCQLNPWKGNSEQLFQEDDRGNLHGGGA